MHSLGIYFWNFILWANFRISVSCHCIVESLSGFVFIFSFCSLLSNLAKVKLKDSEVSKAEAKFLKMKAWSKSRIRQLEQELKKVQVRKYIEFFVRFARKYSAKFNDLLSVFEFSLEYLLICPLTSRPYMVALLNCKRRERKCSANWSCMKIWRQKMV